MTSMAVSFVFMMRQCMEKPNTTAPPKDYSDLAPRPPEGPVRRESLEGTWAEIELEIGFGRGMFLIERAQRVPGHLLIGLEVKKKWAYLVEQRCRTLGLHGARPWFGDAREVLPRLQLDQQLSRVFMHFPDPWWKKRHGKRRLVGGELLDDVARLLKPGGEFFVQTDVEERAQVHADAVATHGAFVLESADFRAIDNPYGAVSNREKRAVEDGLPIYRVVARRGTAG